MKTLLLIRHAKSSWDDIALSDFERPLNDRGKKDAPMMARRLTDKKIKIDGFISSPAKRAKRTATFFAKEFGVDENDIVYKTELYAAPKEVFYDVIEKLDNKLDHVAVFSHNPGITEFANSLTNVRADDMPTCGIFAIKTDVKKWNDFAAAKKEFWFFDYPKLPE
ncbi:MAG: histidine phosphatase family protein [Bacteroidota bacterium]